LGPKLNEGLKTIGDPLHASSTFTRSRCDLLEKVVSQAVTGMSFQPCPHAAARGSRHFRFHTVLFLRYRTTRDAYAWCTSQGYSAWSFSASFQLSTCHDHHFLKHHHTYHNGCVVAIHQFGPQGASPASAATGPNGRRHTSRSPSCRAKPATAVFVLQTWPRSGPLPDRCLANDHVTEPAGANRAISSLQRADSSERDPDNPRDSGSGDSATAECVADI
jgi:hypothetical protein